MLRARPPTLGALRAGSQVALKPAGSVWGQPSLSDQPSLPGTRCSGLSLHVFRFPRGWPPTSLRDLGPLGGK